MTGCLSVSKGGYSDGGASFVDWVLRDATYGALAYWRIGALAHWLWLLDLWFSTYRCGYSVIRLFGYWVI